MCSVISTTLYICSCLIILLITHILHNVTAFKDIIKFTLTVSFGAEILAISLAHAFLSIE